MTEASATSRPTITTPIVATSGCGSYGSRPRASPSRSPGEDHKYVEVTYDLDAKRFDEVRRIVHIIFGMQSSGEAVEPSHADSWLRIIVGIETISRGPDGVFPR
jgi:hypothetical protein